MFTGVILISINNKYLINNNNVVDYSLFDIFFFKFIYDTSYFSCKNKMGHATCFHICLFMLIYANELSYLIYTEPRPYLIRYLNLKMQFLKLHYGLGLFNLFTVKSDHGTFFFRHHRGKSLSKQIRS